MPGTSTIQSALFLPTPRDLRAVRRVLARLGLPAELILLILNLTAYDAAVYASLFDAGPRGRRGSTCPTSSSPVIRVSALEDCFLLHGSCAVRLCLLAPPLKPAAPGEVWRAKAVVWNITSHDQGWGGDPGCRGTFNGARSWYEASILRPTPDIMPARALEPLWNALGGQHCSPESACHLLAEVGYAPVTHPQGENESMTWLVQNNRVAQRDFASYRIEWRAGPYHGSVEDACREGYGSGAGFVDALRPGDVVALWMRAQNPGWMNVVREASVKVLYDVY